MKIKDILQNKDKPTLSFEIFPPNDNVSLKSVMNSASRMAAYNPDFMSVTYKSMGGTGHYTVDIARALNDYMGIPSMAHLTSVSTSKDEIDAIINEMKEKNIKNVLALRGDIPDGIEFPHPDRYSYAYELVSKLKEEGDFSIGVACFPEGHNKEMPIEKEVIYLKEKIGCGADFMVTQLFYDNEVFFRYKELLEKNNIDTPIIAGVMPIVNAGSIKKIAEISNAKIPDRLIKVIEKYKDDKDATLEIGCAFASFQIAELLSSGVSGIHLYTMNRPEIAKRITDQVGSLFF